MTDSRHGKRIFKVQRDYCLLAISLSKDAPQIGFAFRAGSEPIPTTASVEGYGRQTRSDLRRWFERIPHKFKADLLANDLDPKTARVIILCDTRQSESQNFVFSAMYDEIKGLISRRGCGHRLIALGDKDLVDDRSLPQRDRSTDRLEENASYLLQMSGRSVYVGIKSVLDRPQGDTQ